jgi:LPXTG-motif cell wall-anchored protein
VPPIPYVGAASEPVDTGPPIWVWWSAAGLVLAAAAGVLISRRRTTFQDGWGEAGED